MTLTDRTAGRQASASGASRKEAFAQHLASVQADLGRTLKPSELSIATSRFNAGYREAQAERRDS